MSEPAAFALIRDGQTRFFADRWASALLRREVVWGPDDFEAWVSQFEQLDEWAEDCDGGAVVDFDKRRLLWSGDASAYRTPRVRRLYNRLVVAAWPGFDVRITEDPAADLGKRLGIVYQPDDANPDDDNPAHRDSHSYEPRAEHVQDARLDDPDGDDEPEDNHDAPRAWVTVVGPDGAFRHRRLEELSLDLLRGEPGAFEAVVALPPAEIPKEALVAEGLFINTKDRTAFVWGSPELLDKMKTLGRRWHGWTLRWSKQGYAQHCEASGVAGMPMTDAEALAQILPLVLSTEQFSLGTVFGAIGGGVKKFARKATGCLVIVLCLPLLLFGVFSGEWMSVLYAIVATVVVVFGLYAMIVRRVRNAFAKKLPSQGDDAPTIVVAGPQDETFRKQRIDRLLSAAGLPRLAEVEPHFPNATGLELLAT